MNLSPKISRFGVHMFVPYDRKTLIPYGFARIVGSGGLDLSGEIVSLQGGSNRYPFENAHGFIEPKMTVNFKEYPNFLYQLALGVIPTVRDSSAGAIDGQKNISGSSLWENAITQFIVSDEDEVKFGKYTLRINRQITEYTSDSTGFSLHDAVYLDSSGNSTKTASGNTFIGYAAADNAGSTASDIVNFTFDVFASSDIQARRGSNVMSFFDDFLKINHEPIQVMFGSDISIDVLGVDVIFAALTESIFDSITANDTMIFNLFPKADYIRSVVVGRPSDSFPEFGAYILTENAGGKFTFFDAFRCKLNGLPMNITEKTFSESEISIMLIGDGENGIYREESLVEVA